MISVHAKCTHKQTHTGIHAPLHTCIHSTLLDLSLSLFLNFIFLHFAYYLPPSLSPPSHTHIFTPPPSPTAPSISTYDWYLLFRVALTIRTILHYTHGLYTRTALVVKNIHSLFSNVGRTFCISLISHSMGKVDFV